MNVKVDNLVSGPTKGCKVVLTKKDLSNLGQTGDTSATSMYLFEKNQTQAIITSMYLNYWKNKADFYKIVSTFEVTK